MVSLPKINLGISTRKSFFDKTHDVSTTADFGFCAPTLVDEVIPNTDIDLTSNTLVRFAPLPQPSFGRVQLRQYNVFVPMTEVFHAFDYLMAEQTVQSRTNSYKPVTADYVSNAKLLGHVFTHGHNIDYDEDIVFAFPVLWARIDDQGKFTNDTRYRLQPCSVDDELGPTIFNEYHYNSPVRFFKEELIFRHALNYGVNLAVQSPTLGFNNVYSNVVPSFENADFLIQASHMTSSGNVRIYFTWHLTHYGCRLFKILRPCGLSTKYLNNKFPVNTLLAYYKGWFDIFNPGRDLQWKATNAYYLIHAFYDVPTPLENVTDFTDKYFLCFDSLLVDLVNCCYTLDLDPLTVCQNNPFANSTSLSLNVPVAQNESQIVQNGSGNRAPYVASNNLMSITDRVLIKLLPFVNKNSVIGKRVDEYLRVHNLGYQTNESFLFGKNKLPLEITTVMSTSDTATEVDGVRSGSNLGEYAGQSVGAGNFSSKYHAKVFGYVIQYSVIVPFGGYSQDVPNLAHFSRFEFYNHEFDSLGFEAVPESQIFGQSPVLKNNGSDPTFGFRPRLMSYKYKNNARFGDFARRGTMPQLMPYQLDRFFTENDFQEVVETYGGVNFYEVKEVFPFRVRANESLRYIGQTEDMGNYDRIFYDNTGRTDNFIIHIVHDYKIHAPMLPISDSFDTFDNQGLKDDNSNISIQHS